MGNLTNVQTVWLYTAGQNPVGIVKAWDTVEGQWHFYIGTGNGQDIDEDEKLIMEWGQKFHGLDFLVDFARKDPPAWVGEQHGEGH